MQDRRANHCACQATKHTLQSESAPVLARTHLALAGALDGCVVLEVDVEEDEAVAQSRREPVGISWGGLQMQGIWKGARMRDGNKGGNNERVLNKRNPPPQTHNHK